MRGKIPGAEADTFNHMGPVNTWPQIDHSGHYEGSNIMVSAHLQEWSLILSFNEAMICNFLANYSKRQMICNFLANYSKRQQILKHFEILVTGNVVGDWW